MHVLGARSAQLTSKTTPARWEDGQVPAATCRERHQSTDAITCGVGAVGVIVVVVVVVVAELVGVEGVVGSRKLLE